MGKCKWMVSKDLKGGGRVLYEGSSTLYLPGETDKRDENLEEAGQYPNERRAFLLQF
jgi:hypothetical protein